MPMNPHWIEITLRLVLTLVAGFLFGINRLERGRAAGLRTLLLVSMAAAVAMILSNLLLSTTGKSGEYFATMDPMRLPLGKKELVVPLPQSLERGKRKREDVDRIWPVRSYDARCRFDALHCRLGHGCQSFRRDPHERRFQQHGRGWRQTF